MEGHPTRELLPILLVVEYPKKNLDFFKFLIKVSNHENTNAYNLTKIMTIVLPLNFIFLISFFDLFHEPTPPFIYCISLCLCFIHVPISVEIDRLVDFR